MLITIHIDQRHTARTHLRSHHLSVASACTAESLSRPSIPTQGFITCHVGIHGWGFGSAQHRTWRSQIHNASACASAITVPRPNPSRQSLRHGHARTTWPLLLAGSTRRMLPTGRSRCSRPACETHWHSLYCSLRVAVVVHVQHSTHARTRALGQLVSVRGQGHAHKGGHGHGLPASMRWRVRVEPCRSGRSGV